MDIVTLAAARKGGGSGGDVTRKYVDDHLALKADKSETAEYPIASTTTGVNPSITDSADGCMQDVKVYGRSEVVEGEIVSIGDSGSLTITTANSDSSESSTATLTTGLPLCGIPVTTGETYTDGDGVKWLADEMSVEGVIKRVYKITLDGSENWRIQRYGEINCEFYINSLSPTAVQVLGTTVPNIVCDMQRYSPDDLYLGDGTNGICITNMYVFLRLGTIKTVSDLKTYLASNPITAVYILATPTTTPLTTAEKSALRNLRTYNPTTNITVTDAPTVDVGYLLNTDNGQAVADVQTDLQGQINTIPAWLTDIPENHKNIYRGKYLGNSVSAAQLTAIADGSFDDLYIGDYWTIPVTIDGTTVSNKWRIADFDYFLHNGTDKRHAVIVPDNTLYTAQMGGTVSNGYYQSAMFTTNLNKGRTAIANAFPDMVISYEYYDIIGQTTTKYDCTVELMTLSSLTGVYSDYIHTNYLPVLPQMSLFRIMPDFIGANPNGSGHDAGFLTQTVKTSSFYWAISTTVSMMEMRTSDSYGVRPFFLLGDAGT